MNRYEDLSALLFSTSAEFREWLLAYGATGDGVWLLFGKRGGPKTLKAQEALEEALCFGWIDGQMQSLDDTKYIKYFARRRAGSNWSMKNRTLAQALIDQGRMAQAGLEAIQDAKARGTWDAPGRTTIDEDQIEDFKGRVRPYETAYTNLMAMSPSIQRTYTGFYLDAKSERTREARLQKIIDRLNQNLKPM